jgi:uncharacterized protein (DUF58 family)
MANMESGLKIDPSLLQSLKGIELKSRVLMRGMYQSRHRTKDFGASTEFIEHRDYRAGDEIRTIDWRLYARTDRLFVKRHEMESNMRVYFLLDTSDSMRVPPPAGLPTKLELASVIVAAAATLVVMQQDSPGLYCLGDRIEERIPPKQGTLHLSELYQHLESPRGKGGGAFGDLVAEATRWIAPRAMVFIVTDALDDWPPLYEAMKGLHVRGQDVTLFQVMDRDELEFPYDRMTEFRHPESGARVVGDPIRLRDDYLRRLRAYLDQVEADCKKWRIDYMRLHNGEDLVGLLRSHFIRRMLTT